MFPLVSVICLCYNHEKFVKTALESVYYQTYPNLEIIIVDDASTDKSKAVIERFLADLDHYQNALATDNQLVRKINFIANPANIGNCKSFNQAFAQTKGQYIVDFATDDVMLDERISRQVAAFEKLAENYGVVFSNALDIDENGQVLKAHYPLDANQKSKIPVPQGDVYVEILKRYFISPPTMMIKRQVLSDLGAYDETLSYEDFDFWVRSARKYHYFYLDEVTTYRRELKNSLSKQFYQKGANIHQISTLKVCEKALQLNTQTIENQALIQRIKFQTRQAFFTQNFSLVEDYARLLAQTPEFKMDVLTRLILTLARYKIPVFYWYKLYYSWKNWLRI
jgi:glycosyltransferase involved in cell wall biosynthesis